MRTVYMLKPLSEEAKEWIEEHVHYESYQVVGESIGVEHRYISDIVNAMIQQGLKQGIDFEVL